MQLDFTAIRENLAETIPRETATDAPESPETAFNGLALSELLEPSKKPSEGKTESNLEGEKSGRLAIQYSQEQAKIDRTREVYREYQRNIKISGSLRVEILKGVKAGELPVSLLLKAAKCISLMTSDTVFYSQLEGDIMAIYGQGLLDPLTLRIELQQTQERLIRLREAEQRELDGDSKERIKRAVKAHEAKIADLESLIQRERTKAKK